jgi:hypothetical protein
VKGIEPSSSAWKAVALPLSYTRKQTTNVEFPNDGRHSSFVIRHSIIFPHWGVQDSNLRRHKPSDLQSDPFDRFGNSPRDVSSSIAEAPRERNQALLHC